MGIETFSEEAQEAIKTSQNIYVQTAMGPGYNWARITKTIAREKLQEHPEGWCIHHVPGQNAAGLVPRRPNQPDYVTDATYE